MAPPIRVGNGGNEVMPRRRAKHRRRTTTAGNRPGAATGGTSNVPTLHTQQLKRTYSLAFRHGIEHAFDTMNIPVPPGMLAPRG
jgi:hypothetical protein